MKVAVLLSVLLLAACASTPHESSCTHEQAVLMSDKVSGWVNAETKRMGAPEGKSLDELKAGLDKIQDMTDRMNRLQDATKANDDLKLCKEARDFAADYNFSVE